MFHYNQAKSLLKREFLIAPILLGIISVGNWPAVVVRKAVMAPLTAAKVILVLSMITCVIGARGICSWEARECPGYQRTCEPGWSTGWIMWAIIAALAAGAVLGGVGAVIGGALGMSFDSFNFQFNIFSKLDCSNLARPSGSASLPRTTIGCEALRVKALPELKGYGLYSQNVLSLPVSGN